MKTIKYNTAQNKSRHAKVRRMLATTRRKIRHAKDALFERHLSMPHLSIPNLKVTAIMVGVLAPYSEPPLSHMDDIRRHGHLAIVTTHPFGDASNTAFNDINLEIARQFAEDNGIGLRIIYENDADKRYLMLNEGHADIASAGLSIDALEPSLQFSTPYHHTNLKLIHKTGTSSPDSWRDVTEEVIILSGSSQQHHANQLSEQHPHLRWKAVPSLTTEQRLSLVNNGGAVFTVVEADEFALQRFQFPELHSSLELNDGHGEAIAIATGHENDNTLIEALDQFILDKEADGTLEALRERFYGHLVFNYVGAKAFLNHIEQRLPKYQAMFEAAGDRHDLDWRLLAAIAYQESLWNPRAVSPTGVRGIMMMTLRTAREAGIKNRIDAAQSIKGGSWYFKKIYDRLPNDILDPDRTWQALAAYNMGYGHLRDAHNITDSLGGDYRNWFDVQESLPLLQDPQWYRKTTFGFSRSARQAIVYVRNTRLYYETLLRLTETSQKPATTLAANDTVSPTE